LAAADPALLPTQSHGGRAPDVLDIVLPQADTSRRRTSISTQPTVDYVPTVERNEGRIRAVSVDEENSRRFFRAHFAAQP